MIFSRRLFSETKDSLAWMGLVRQNGGNRGYDSLPIRECDFKPVIVARLHKPAGLDIEVLGDLYFRVVTTVTAPLAEPLVYIMKIINDPKNVDKKYADH
jgi:hypothetical protein